ncbi:MAG: EF-hand domain-containing protein [Thermodesulfobacteriota bacterium]
MRRPVAFILAIFLCFCLGSCASLYNEPVEAAPDSDPFLSDPVPGDQDSLGSFEALDGNGDGYIDEQEWMRSFPNGDTQIFLNTDKNKDAKIDMQEFKNINQGLNLGN